MTTPILGILQALAMMMLPFAVAHFFGRRHGFSWKLAGIGAAFFLLAQLFKGATLIIPLKVAGISANAFAKTFAYGIVAAALPGFWEELLKYWPMKSFMREKTWRNAVIFGLGFGGIEAFYLGFQILMIEIVASQNPGVLPPELRAQFAAAFTPAMIGTAVLAVMGTPGGHQPPRGLRSAELEGHRDSESKISRVRHALPLHPGPRAGVLPDLRAWARNRGILPGGGLGLSGRSVGAVVHSPGRCGHRRNVTSRTNPAAGAIGPRRPV